MHLLNRKILLIFLSVITTCVFSQQDYNYDNSDELRFRYKEVSFGANYSTYSHYHQSAIAIRTNSINLIFSSSGNSISQVFNYIYPPLYTHNVYHIGGSLAEYFNFGNNIRIYYKTFLSIGKDSDNDPDHLDNSSHNSIINLFESNLVGGLDIEWFGIEAGTHIGNMRRWDGMNGEKDGTLSYGKKDLIVHFGGKLRLGGPKIIFFETRLGNPYFGLNGSKFPYTVGLGTGLGKDNGNVLRACVGLAGQQSLVGIVGYKLRIYKNFGIETDFCFGDSTFIYFTIFKRFAKKEIKKKV